MTLHTILLVVSSALLLVGVSVLARGLFIYAGNSSLTTGLIATIKKSLLVGSALVIGGTGVYSSTLLIEAEAEPALIRASVPSEEAGAAALENIPRGPLGND